MECCCFLALSQNVLNKTGPKKHRLAKLQGVIFTPDALINKRSHLHIHYKLLGHCPKMDSFRGKNSKTLPSHRHPQNKSKPRISTHTRATIQGMARHSSFPSELQAILLMDTHLTSPITQCWALGRERHSRAFAAQTCPKLLA